MNEARGLATEGAQRAIEHADAVMDGWGAEALQWVVAVAAMEAEFTAGFVRDFATERGFTEAPEPRAWGAVLKRAHAEGKIEPTSRFICTGRLKSHGRPERIWRRPL